MLAMKVVNNKRVIENTKMMGYDAQYRISYYLQFTWRIPLQNQAFPLNPVLQ